MASTLIITNGGSSPITIATVEIDVNDSHTFATGDITTAMADVTFWLLLLQNTIQVSLNGYVFGETGTPITPALLLVLQAVSNGSLNLP